VINFVFAARLLLVDSALVELEAVVGCVNGNRYGANSGHSLGEGIFVSLGKVYVALVSGTNSHVVESAHDILPSFVRVACLRVNAMIVMDVLEGIVIEAAIAAVVSIEV